MVVTSSSARSADSHHVAGRPDGIPVPCHASGSSALLTAMLLAGCAFRAGASKWRGSTCNKPR